MKGVNKMDINSNNVIVFKVDSGEFKKGERWLVKHYNEDAPYVLLQKLNKFGQVSLLSPKRSFNKFTSREVFDYYLLSDCEVDQVKRKGLEFFAECSGVAK